jgi:hypothetical protein
VGPVDPDAPPAPLEVDAVVVDDPPCPEPLELVVVGPLPVVPVPVLDVVSDVEPWQVSTFGSHLTLPSSAHPTNADAPAETITPKPKRIRNVELRRVMCFLNL